MRTLWSRVVPVAALLVGLIVQPVFAGSGVGGVFNLGVTNTVNKVTVLKGSASTALLRVTNDGTGPALNLNVKNPGTAPMTLDAESTGKVQYLNADQVDGLDAHSFVTGPGKIVSGAWDAFQSGGFYDMAIVNDFWQVVYFCPNNSNDNGIVRFFNRTNSADLLFYDNGGPDPAFQPFTYPAGIDIAASRTGEWVHLQLYSPTKGIADIDVFSVHRGQECHVQVMAVMSTP